MTRCRLAIMRVEARPTMAARSRKKMLGPVAGATVVSSTGLKTWSSAYAAAE